MPRSLFRLHPRRLDVPIAITLAAAALVTGLSLPVMTIEKLIFWEDSYSIIQGAAALVDNGHWFLGAVIFGFSVVFPIAKLIALLVLWFLPMDVRRRERALRATEALGRWSMLDVFVVALTVVLTSSKALLGAEPAPGLYVFTGAIILSMLVAFEMARISRRSGT